MVDTSVESQPPPDKYKLVYLTFLIHGIGVLLPWNMFITADKYFTEYKLSRNYTGHDSPYLTNFLQYLTFAAQIPNVFCNWINIFVQLGDNLSIRIIWGIIAELVIFVITVLLAMVNSSTWSGVFFWLTISCVVILNMANGIYQNTIFGMTAKLPEKYTGAVILGNNICGTFTAIVNILSYVLTSNVRIAAIYFFITAIFVLLVCFDTYYALPLNRFYRYNELRERKKAEQTQREQQNQELPQRVPYLNIMKKASFQFYNVFIVYFVTLSIFPAIQANIRQSDRDFFIDANYYAAVTCFLTFNFCAMLGCFLTTFVQRPRSKLLWIFVTARLFYIPFFFFANYQVPGQERHTPVYINNDWVYWIVGATLGLTHGYFASLAMMYAPRAVEEKHASVAGMFAAAFLITGVFSGILSTFIWPLLT